MKGQLNIKRFVTNPIGENCYLVWDDTRECAIIDCGALGADKEEKIAQFIKDNQLTPRMALQTHMHFDHIWGLSFLYHNYGLQPLCHRGEREIYEDAPQVVRLLFHKDIPTVLVPVLRYLDDNEEITFGNTTFRVIHTPGHTPGCIMFYQASEGVLFSGDTLFQGSIGRTDHLGGNTEQEIQSIRSRVLTLPDDVVVYPGHGPSTTIGEERYGNPYL